MGIDSLRGVLLDVDGTLLHGEAAVPGAAASVARLRDRGISLRLVTNTTRRPRSAIVQALREAGIAAEEAEVVTPCLLARRRILESGRTSAALLVPEATKVDFHGVEEDAARPSWVVVGDLGRGFTWDRLNQAFHWLRDGAALLALHKNPCWHAGARGLVIDAGPFVAALEYAAGVEAEVVGKPSRAFFDLSLAEIGLSASEVLVVGDDVDNDCVGGAAAGCRTALVRTGKFDEGRLVRSGARPDLVLPSIADLGL